MLPGTVTEISAWGFGIFGMICLAVWPLLRTPASMLSVQLGAVAGLSLHYALSGVTTAAVVNALGALQIGFALLWGGRPGMGWVGYALACAMVASAIVTWQGMISILAATGMALVAIGRLQRDARSMRRIVLAGGPFWLLHDVLVASPVAIADALSLAAGLGHMARESVALRRRRLAIYAWRGHRSSLAG